MEKEWLEHLAPFRNHTLILGCSGGIDSMVLLHFLVKHKFSIHIVHVNYHQRGQESDSDQALVEEVAKSIEVPLDVFHYSDEKSKSTNFQESARIFRYECFAEIAENYEKSKILLAHHADDQVETFFMNLSRKSGIIGLAGMPFERSNIIRPMIWSFKTEILDYAKANKVIWHEDASNESNKYFRNRWRNEFIPWMEKETADLKKSVVLLMKAFQLQQQIIESTIKEIHSKILKTNELSVSDFNLLSIEEHFEIWRQLGQISGTFEKFEQLIHLEKGKKVEMIGDFEFVSHEHNSLYFSPSKKSINSTPKLVFEELNELPSTFSKQELYLDKDLITGELQVRKWEQGDRIASIGMKGSQLVSDIIKDAKIPSHQKNDIWVVEDSNEIHWVVDLKIGRNALAHKSSTRILKVGIRTFDGTKP